MNNLTKLFKDINQKYTCMFYLPFWNLADTCKLETQHFIGTFLSATQQFSNNIQITPNITNLKIIFMFVGDINK